MCWGPFSTRVVVVFSRYKYCVFLVGSTFGRLVLRFFVCIDLAWLARMGLGCLLVGLLVVLLGSS